MSDRKDAFDAVVEAYDEKALAGCVDFKAHRFISIERDAQTVNRYVKGHCSLREACDYLSRATEEGEPYVPESIVDLDTGKSYELSLFAFVAPTEVEPVAVLMPRRVAVEALPLLAANEPAHKLMKQALNRRYG